MKINAKSLQLEDVADKSIPSSEDGVTALMVDGMVHELAKDGDEVYAGVKVHETAVDLSGSGVVMQEGRASINNPLFAHMRSTFSREALFKNKAQLDVSTLDGVLSHRTRLQVNNVLSLRSHNETVITKGEITLGHPISLGVLSKPALRKYILDFLVDKSTIDAMCEFFVGKTGKAKMNERRFTFEQLCAWMRARLVSKALPAVNYNGDLQSDVAIVCSRIVKEIVDQFGWEYETIVADFYQKPSVSLVTVDNLAELYIEGWIAQRVPDTKAWVMEFGNSDNTIFRSVFADIVVSSIAKLRVLFIPLDVLDKRCADVIFAAKLQALVNAGFSPSVKNDTLLNFMAGSSAIQEMSKWWPIVKEVFVGDTSFMRSLSTQLLHVGDVGLLNAFAEEVLSSITSHPRVINEAAGEYLKMIGIEHFNLVDRDDRFHTHVYGMASQDMESRTLIEVPLSDRLFNVTPIAENEGWQTANVNMAKEIHLDGMKALAELDRLKTFGALSAFDDPEKIWAKGEYALTVTNVRADDILMLCLLNSELVVRYTSTTDVGNVEAINILDWHYIMRGMQSTTAAPYTLGLDEVYTQSPLLVLATLTAKSGTSKVGYSNLGIVNSSYLLNSLKDTFNGENVRGIPTRLAHQFALKANDGSTAQITVAVDVNRYLLLSKVDETILFTSPELAKVYKQLAYILNIMCQGNTFTMVELNYEAERVKAGVVTKMLDKSLQINFVGEVAQESYYQVAESTSGQVSSWSVAYHNLQSRANCLAFAVAGNLFLSGLNSKIASTLAQAFKRNRLIRDFVFNKVK